MNLPISNIFFQLYKSFSSDLRIFESKDYQQKKVTVFHSLFLCACEKRDSAGSVCIGHYVLPPVCVQDGEEQLVLHLFSLFEFFFWLRVGILRLVLNKPNGFEARYLRFASSIACYYTGLVLWFQASSLTFLPTRWVAVCVAMNPCEHAVSTVDRKVHQKDIKVTPSFFFFVVVPIWMESFDYFLSHL